MAFCGDLGEQRARSGERKCQVRLMEASNWYVKVREVIGIRGRHVWRIRTAERRQM
jgi:hypothetical protein